MLLAKVVRVKAQGLSVSPQGDSPGASQRAPISALQLLFNFLLFFFSSCVTFISLTLNLSKGFCLQDCL